MSAHFRDGRSELEAIGPLAHGPLASVELGDFLFDAMIPDDAPAYRGGSRSRRTVR